MLHETSRYWLRATRHALAGSLAATVMLAQGPRATSEPDVSGLPLVEVRGAAHTGTLAVFLSGDGGWADIDKKIEDIDAHVARIQKDQERLRSNLGQVPKDSDLAKHYLETLAAQENELAGLARDRSLAEQAQTAAKAKLDDEIAAMKF